LFKSKQRTAAAWAKGLMLGKAVGAKDERQRIIAMLETEYLSLLESIGREWHLQEAEKADILVELIKSLRGQKDD
jgi:hypothetical protein